MIGYTEPDKSFHAAVVGKKGETYDLKLLLDSNKGLYKVETPELGSIVLGIGKYLG